MHNILGSILKTGKKINKTGNQINGTQTSKQNSKEKFLSKRKAEVTESKVGEHHRIWPSMKEVT